MFQEIKLQTSKIANIVGLLLILNGIVILRSINSNLKRFEIHNIGLETINSLVYLMLLIIPFIFLVKFLLDVQKANRNDKMLFLKDAFEQLKIYFMLLIVTKIIRIILGLFWMVRESMF